MRDWKKITKRESGCLPTMPFFPYLSAAQLIYFSLLKLLELESETLSFEEHGTCAMCAGPLFEVRGASLKSLLPDVGKDRISKITVASGGHFASIPVEAIKFDSFIRGFEVRPHPANSGAPYICLACVNSFSASGPGELLTNKAIFAARDGVYVPIKANSPAWGRLKNQYPNIRLCPDTQSFVSAVLGADPDAVQEYGITLAMTDSFRRDALFEAVKLASLQEEKAMFKSRLSKGASLNKKGVSLYLTRFPVSYDPGNLVFSYEDMLGWVPAEAVKEAYAAGKLPKAGCFPAPTSLFLEAVAAAGFASRQEQKKGEGQEKDITDRGGESGVLPVVA